MAYPSTVLGGIWPCYRSGHSGQTGKLLISQNVGCSSVVTSTIAKYCRTGNFRLEYIFAIFVRQASLTKFDVYQTFCHVIRCSHTYRGYVLDCRKTKIFVKRKVISSKMTKLFANKNFPFYSIEKRLAHSGVALVVNNLYIQLFNDVFVLSTSHPLPPHVLCLIIFRIAIYAEYGE